MDGITAFWMVGLNKVVCDCVLWRSGSHWYAGNWKSCNVCRIFSVKAIFETRGSRPKLMSSTREQNFQKCPALMPNASIKLWKAYHLPKRKVHRALEKKWRRHTRLERFTLMTWFYWSSETLYIHERFITEWWWHESQWKCYSSLHSA